VFDFHLHHWVFPLVYGEKFNKPFPKLIAQSIYEVNRIKMVKQDFFYFGDKSFSVIVINVSNLLKFKFKSFFKPTIKL